LQRYIEDLIVRLPPEQRRSSPLAASQSSAGALEFLDEAPLSVMSLFGPFVVDPSFGEQESLDEQPITPTRGDTSGSEHQP
jgi:hypothetical protein